jgi:hypothetical protein
MVFRAGRKKYIPTWFWLIFFGIPAFILAKWFLWWFLSPSYKRPFSDAHEIEAPRGGPQPLPEVKDDFTIIKGVGPKTAAALDQAGIKTFEQLGLMKLKEFTALLEEYKLPTANAAFWQEQARLAAVENWSELEKLQS